jgi:hypothetical protein
MVMINLAPYNASIVVTRFANISFPKRTLYVDRLIVTKYCIRIASDMNINFHFHRPERDCLITFWTLGMSRPTVMQPIKI